LFCEAFDEEPRRGSPAWQLARSQANGARCGHAREFRANTAGVQPPTSTAGSFLAA